MMVPVVTRLLWRRKCQIRLYDGWELFERITNSGLPQIKEV